VAEHRDGVLVIGGGDDVVDARFDPRDERGISTPVGSSPLESRFMSSSEISSTGV
jgi:hypothetical protein